MGLISHLKTPIDEFLSKYNFDFIIGSSHFVGNIEPCQPVFWENRSEKDAIYSYFESILENVKTFNNYDIYGDLDYVVRYAPSKSKAFNIKDYEELISEILKNIIKNAKGIEINTGSFRNNLGYKFKIVEDLMKEIGFKYYSVYKNRIPRLYKV